MTADQLAQALQDVLDADDRHIIGSERAAKAEARRALAKHRSQAPAEGAGAVPSDADIEWPDIDDLAHSAAQEAYSFGISHDLFKRWMTSAMFKTASAIRAAMIAKQEADQPDVQPKGTAKCNCTAYCGQYLMHGSCPAYPAAVTVVPAPAPLTSVCHMECGGCIDAGKCAFPGKPAEPARYPHPDEDDAVTLWAEIHRLRAAVQGPDGYATWQEAATAERVRRVAAEKALAATQSPAPVDGPAITERGRHHVAGLRSIRERHELSADELSALTVAIAVMGNPPAIPCNEELERVAEGHQGHPADFAADVLQRWGGWQPGLLGYGGKLNATQAPAVQAGNWYDLRPRPPMLELGRTYTTTSGKKVRMVSISNAGTEYESMADEDGHHRYSRSHGRVIGRCTGSPKDDPLNIPFDPPPAFYVPVQGSEQ